MNPWIVGLFVACVASLGLWDVTRTKLVALRREHDALLERREADLRALETLQRDRDAIARRYEAALQDLSEITDAPSVDYLNAPVPGSVRKLLNR